MTPWNQTGQSDCSYHFCVIINLKINSSPQIQNGAWFTFNYSYWCMVGNNLCLAIFLFFSFISPGVIRFESVLGQKKNLWSPVSRPCLWDIAESNNSRAFPRLATYDLTAKTREILKKFDMNIIKIESSSLSPTSAMSYMKHQTTQRE